MDLLLDHLIYSGKGGIRDNIKIQRFCHLGHGVEAGQGLASGDAAYVARYRLPVVLLTAGHGRRWRDERCVSTRLRCATSPGRCVRSTFWLANARIVLHWNYDRNPDKSGACFGVVEPSPEFMPSRLVDLPAKRRPTTSVHPQHEMRGESGRVGTEIPPRLEDERLCPPDVILREVFIMRRVRHLIEATIDGAVNIVGIPPGPSRFFALEARIIPIIRQRDHLCHDTRPPD